MILLEPVKSLTKLIKPIIYIHVLIFNFNIISFYNLKLYLVYKNILKGLFIILTNLIFTEVTLSIFYVFTTKPLNQFRCIAVQKQMKHCKKKNWIRFVVKIIFEGDDSLSWSQHVIVILFRLVFVADIYWIITLIVVSFSIHRSRYIHIIYIYIFIR